MEHLKSLNQAQKEAVLTTEGPVLVLAGAGAGKTRTIAHRIVHLVKSSVPADRILAITFTNKAAREMRERVYGLLAEEGLQGMGRPTVSTFHALAAMLLREFADAADIKRHFTINDRSDSLRAIKKALRDAGEDDKRFEPRTVLSVISRAKGDGIPLSRFREETGHAWFQTIVADVWQRYDAALRKDGALDFDDLLLLLSQLLASNAHVRSALNERWHYIHVDEYQDTNKVQYDIVRLLAGERRNIFCVGDLDQNVYSWRGSTIENILEFEKEFPDATILRLEENYRSTKTIVAVSNDIIKKNKRRKEKTLFTNNADGELLSLTQAWNEADEAQRVAESVEELLGAGVAPKDIAVLYRANFQSRVLEQAFLDAGLPYKVLGTRFFDRAEVKDMLAYVRAALNQDSESDVRRVISAPARGIGKITVERLFEGGRGALSGPAREKVEGFFRILADIHERAQRETASATLAYTLERSGIGVSLGSGHDEDTERLENVKELVSLAKSRYDELPAPEGLLRLLEDAALATDQDELDHRTAREKQNAVALMTVHASKGLEYRHVFITGLEDGLFPHERTEGLLSNGADDEEERRLFYVALTRAKEKVHLSYAQSRTVFGQTAPRMPSEFLLDIGEEYIETSLKPKRGKVIYLD